MRRLLSAILSAILIAGLLPLQVLAAAPVAEDASVSVTEDVAKLITLAATRGDGELTFSVLDQPQHGSLSGTGPDFIYTPDLNYSGGDSFTFKVNDTVVDSNTATVSINVTAVNDPPVANDDPSLACDTGAFGGSFPIPEDWSGGSIGFEDWFGLVGSCAPTANDTDPDGDELTLEVVGSPQHGATASSPDGFLAYDPELNYSTRRGDQPGGTWVSDTISYRVFDGELYSNTASYRLWIAPVNDAPSFTAGGVVTVDEDSGAYSTAWATSISPGPDESYQVVDFIVDPVDDPSLFATAPAISSSGVLTFTPAAGRYGLSALTVRARDDGGLESYPGVSVTPEDTSASQTLTIVVNAVNDQPVCSPLTLDTNKNVPVDDTVICTDVDSPTLAFRIGTPPVVGTVASFDTVTGAFRYSPDAGATGRDSFTVIANDGTADSLPAIVDIAIGNYAPVAGAQSVTTNEDTAKPITLAGTDVDLDTLTYAIVANPAHGNLSGTAPDLTYTPQPNYDGPDSFTFKVNDGTATSAPATVSISVSAVNDAPVARTDGFTVNATTTTTLTVLANDYSAPVVNGVISEPTDAITVQSVGAASRGRVAIVAGGTAVSYDPSGCTAGGDSFTYTIVDGGGLTATATAFVTIARPGANGLSSNPITDTPTLRFIAAAPSGPRSRPGCPGAVCHAAATPSVHTGLGRAEMAAPATRAHRSSGARPPRRAPAISPSAPPTGGEPGPPTPPAGPARTATPWPRVSRGIRRAAPRSLTRAAGGRRRALPTRAARSAGRGPRGPPPP